MSKTLILNASTEPLTFVPVRRAVLLVLKNKAEIVETREGAGFRSEKMHVPYPLVIRLVAYVRIPRRFRVVVSNALLFARDEHTCQYCGRHKSKLKKHEHLTREHILPISRGGTDEWENVTTACSTCNHRKGDKLANEIRMHPRTLPYEPRYIAVVLLHVARHDAQRRYIEPFLEAG